MPSRRSPPCPPLAPTPPRPMRTRRSRSPSWATTAAPRSPSSASPPRPTAPPGSTATRRSPTRPKTGYTGTDTFKYTIRDGAGAKSTAKVTVTVRNRAPVAGADSAATDANTPVRIAVLANDSDPDGHVLSLAAVTQPTNGAVVVNADKTVTYTPAPGFTGSDGFSYSLSDGRGGTRAGCGQRHGPQPPAGGRGRQRRHRCQYAGHHRRARQRQRPGWTCADHRCRDAARQRQRS